MHGLLKSMPRLHDTPPLHAGSDALFAIFQSSRMQGGTITRHLLQPGESLVLGEGEGCFHFIEQATARLHADAAVVSLQAGELLLMPHGRTHRIDCAADAAGPSCLTTASFGFEGPGSRLLLDALPGWVHVPGVDRMPSGFPANSADWMAVTLAAIQAEATRPTLGSGLMLSRLLDLLFVWTLRYWLGTSSPHNCQRLHALADPLIGRALALLQAHPARAWTVECLAACLNQSRSNFAQRFSLATGMSPMRYLAQSRLQLAAQLLRSGNRRVSQIAGDVGYLSEPAFSRAFRRQFGVSPNTWRQQVPAPKA
ncbi:cupin domain-containing protein [Stenotrophomonas maltophilia]|uniref:cupin domain-containing protein n=1 Tax=Stenotrophomonas maltophilia TaxID=40324 RepID=UPI001F103BDD|nr:AraC family transcriptional regulator [Stenotrophomonas maltophilia]